MKKYNGIFVFIGILLLMQACTTEPKLQLKAGKIDTNAPLFEEKWKECNNKTQNGHTIECSENEYVYRIVSKKSGKKDGFERVYDKKTKKIRFESFYKNGLRDGFLKKYSPEGWGLYKAVLYNNGEKREVREYNQKGEMVHSTPYLDGEKHGVEQKFSYTRGYLEFRIKYEHGTIREVREYCAKGRVANLVPMNGCRIGVDKSWYCDSGTLKRETPYKSCKINGVEKSYDEKGNLLYSVSYKNGKKNGVTKEYYPNGGIKYKLYYRDDKPNETGYFYDKNGKKERIDYDTLMSFTKRLPKELPEWLLGSM